MRVFLFWCAVALVHARRFEDSLDARIGAIAAGDAPVIDERAHRDLNHHWHAMGVGLGTRGSSVHLQTAVEEHLRACASDTRHREMIRAVVEGNTDAAAQLLDEGLDVNACLVKNVTALHLAVVTNNIDTIVMLAMRRADPLIQMMPAIDARFLTAIFETYDAYLALMTHRQYWAPLDCWNCEHACVRACPT